MSLKTQMVRIKTHYRTISSFQKKIIIWWYKNKRDFPWRNTTEPFNILIAEMLLRKTTAKQVNNIYEYFIRRYNSPKLLSKAKKNELEKILLPLGMEHRRAELLIRLASEILKKHKGIVPDTYKYLIQLPGVGKYTGNSVMCFSFNKDVPVVDTNFIRIIERVFSKKPEKSRAREDKEIWNFAQILVPKKKFKEFNWAVLDFGALVCKAKKPKCMTCCLNGICQYYKGNS
ncbi:Adenine DNA glycosylase [subsurface metagenome]